MKLELKTIIKIIATVVLIVLATVAVYVGYVLVTYDRIEDNQVLSIEEPGNPAKDSINTGETYTIGTYNVGFGAYTPEYSFFMDGGEYSRCLSKEAAYKNVLNAAETVKSFEPDFMMFQEVDRHSTRSYYVNQEKVVDRVFDGYYKSFAINYNSAYFMYPLKEPIGKSLSGVAFYSKAPINSSVRRSLPISDSFDKLFDLDRCYTKSYVPVTGDKFLCLFTLHLSAYNEDESVREGQTDMLISDMAEEYEKGNYVIVGGDFNHELSLMDESVKGKYGWTYPFPRSKFPDGLAFATDTLHNNKLALQPTERNTDAPYDPDKTETFVLDGFIVSDNVKVTDYKVIRTGYMYSDHEPVLMKFELR